MKRLASLAQATLVASAFCWTASAQLADWSGDRSFHDDVARASVLTLSEATTNPNGAHTSGAQVSRHNGQPADDPQPPTGVETELNEIRPGVAFKRELDRIADKTNIRFGIAYTMLFQQATGGPNDRTAGGGDIDLLAKWTLVGAKTKDTGILVFAGEERHQIGDQAPSALGGQIGTLNGTTNGFSERPLIVKELYWDQRFLDDRFRFAVGRIDPENLFGGHRLQSANLYFFNKAFSTNVTVVYPGASFAVAALLKPVPWFYIDGGLADANGKFTTVGIESFFEDGEFLSFIETGLTPTIDKLGTGRYRLAIWHIDSRDDANVPSDEGITLSMDQDFGKQLTAFLRIGYADGRVTKVRTSIQGGVGIKGVLGDQNMLGLAAAWSNPYSSSSRDETVFELFQRFQITETFQFTLGSELIVSPGNTTQDDVLGVFSARLRFSF